MLYHEWFPQILYNHHQSGPAGTVVWSSPQRDPYNYNLDPLLILGLQALGTHMHQRLAAEGKPGATMASGGAYDGWWNGGIRNTGNFHNIIAILTEMIGSPTPMRIPLVIAAPDSQPRSRPTRSRRRSGTSSSRSTIRSRSTARCIDYAARNRENLLYNIYAMGKHSIERGSTDTWTPSPTRLQMVAGPDGSEAGAAATPERDAELWAELRKPELTAIRAATSSRRTSRISRPRSSSSTRCARSTSPCSARRASSTWPARRYPAGSFVVLTAQAFRPHVMDMFEPQDHPNVIPYPGAPPTPPYDNAGWTLAYQMGVAVRSHARAVHGTVREA